MKRRLVSAIAASALVIGAVVAVPVTAAATPGINGCHFQIYDWATYTETFRGNCGLTRARFDYRTTNGGVFQDIAYWHTWSETSRYPSPWRVANYGQVWDRNQTSGWKVP
ncbi:hypothetical protein RDI86_05740 [Cellulosimicrobium sp. XJ-DQ-B-000]|uniref:hypothetical protein n=1 Tax=Cellulosimicrobium sp. XJ-DQ-B-000 TaxID=3072182 RepID=UPI0028096DB5|nr:hypothetical protein [Cellulosimicrobium sp. XJ-DQ-B-000]MDQ8041353.1 hypothetical protein [Cellulosimicrobium sp. XJ-DQ-B-000]